MTKPIARGVPHPSGVERKRAQEVGPYPPWDAWKHNIENELGVELDELDHDVYRFKEIYTARRLIQLGAKEDVLREVERRIDEENSDFWRRDRNLEIIQFIASHTVPAEVKAEVRAIRRR